MKTALASGIILSVDLVSENWNQLHSWAFEASEAILNMKTAERGA